MKIGLCKEIKTNEGRVAMTPGNVAELVQLGHDVYFEKDCGILSGFSNSEYEKAGATRVDSHSDMFKKSEFIVRVKEIEESEYDLIQEGQIILAYFHLTADLKETNVLLEKNATCIDYEYFVNPDTNRRAVTMSPIAGRLGVLLGANYMYSIYGGNGVLPMGVPGVEPATITVMGAGDAGLGAIKAAIGLGAQVNILETNTRKLEELENIFGNSAHYYISNRDNLLRLLPESDAFVNCVFWPKLRTDHIVYEDDLKMMKKSAVLIDISCDINGAVETCKATSHDNPTYVVNDVIHYCVDNIPGAVPITSSKYLAAQSFSFIKDIAKGKSHFLKNDMIKNATLLHQGNVTHALIADKWDLPLKMI
jgi:alanine dehydrogenase